MVTYEKVHEIQSGSTLEEDGGIFISEADAQNIRQKKGEHFLLYFVRSFKLLRPTYNPPIFSGFHYGDRDNPIVRSVVEGPSNFEPVIQERKGEYYQQVLRRVLPVEEMPASFEKVELIEYGINLTGDASERVYNDGETAVFQHDSDTILRSIGDRVLEKLRPYLVKPVEKEGSSPHEYLAVIDGLVTGFRFPAILRNPEIKVRILGKEESNPLGLIERLGLRSLEEVLIPAMKERGIIDIRRKGVAYDLSLDKEFRFDLLHGYKNIIL